MPKETLLVQMPSVYTCITEGAGGVCDVLVYEPGSI